MISEKIRKAYRPEFIVEMSPHFLAVAMLDEDFEYLEWKKGRGAFLTGKISDLRSVIDQLETECLGYEKEYDDFFNKSVKRLEPKAEQDLQEFIQEHIRKGIKEDFNHDQEISEETGDR